MANITFHVANRYTGGVTYLAEFYGAQTSTNFEVIDSSGVLKEVNLGTNFTYSYNGFFNGGTINTVYLFAPDGSLAFSATGLSWSVYDRNNSLSVGTSSDNYFRTMMSGNDKITGSSGDDKILGSRGNDTIDGGAGVDVLSFKGFSTSVNVNLSTGIVTNYYGTSSVVNVEDVEGSGYGDVLFGNAANNSFQGFGGNDTISGGGGFDTASYLDATSAVTINFSTGTATGGSGSDTLSSIERVIGSRFNDTLIGSSANESFLGGFGNDNIDGGGGVDTVEYSGVGSGVTVDLTAGTASGGAGTDTLVNIENVSGSIFADLITGNSIANTLIGYAGNDVLNGMGGNDILRGGAGKDTLDGGAGVDTADYSDKTTAVIATLNGATNASVTVGGVAEDTIRNIENLTGGSAADTLTGDDLANTLIGNAGNDVLNGMGGNDILRGGAGKDTLDGGAGVDTADYSDKTTAVIATLNGATNASVTVGGVAEDTIRNIENLTGGSAADTLTGDGLANTLIGNAGNDVLNGMGGNDILRGGLGNDTLTGGAGQDIFRFDTALNGTTNVDRIMDFVVADDTIQLSKSIFTALGTTAGVINADFFKANTTGLAADSNDYIVYETDTGKLFYDADGNGAGASVQIALLGTNLGLTNADFFLI